MATNRVMRLLSVAAVAPLLLSSCDSGNPLDPFDAATGTYDLTIFADASMPATFNCSPGACSDIPNGGTIAVNSGTLRLDSDGTYVELNHFTFNETGFAPRNGTYRSSGTFSLDGERLTLDDDDGTRFVSGSLQFLPDRVRVSYDEDNVSYEYIKR